MSPCSVPASGWAGSQPAGDWVEETLNSQNQSKVCVRPDDSSGLPACSVNNIFRELFCSFFIRGVGWVSHRWKRAGAAHPQRGPGPASSSRANPQQNTSPGPPFATSTSSPLRVAAWPAAARCRGQAAWRLGPRTGGSSCGAMSLRCRPLAHSTRRRLFRAASPISGGVGREQWRRRPETAEMREGKGQGVDAGGSTVRNRP